MVNEDQLFQDLKEGVQELGEALARKHGATNYYAIEHPTTGEYTFRFRFPANPGERERGVRVKVDYDTGEISVR